MRSTSTATDTSEDTTVGDAVPVPGIATTTTSTFVATDEAGGTATVLTLQACVHQAGGHVAGKGGAATFTDSNGRFYKVFQDEVRGGREVAFYERIWSDTPTGAPLPSAGSSSSVGTTDAEPAASDAADIAVDLWQLRSFIPRFFGRVEQNGQHLMALSDMTHGFSKPCVLDAKMGYTTAYPWASSAYIEKNSAKDRATTQASLGFKVCGYQVYQPATTTFHKVGKEAGSLFSPEAITAALTQFATCGDITPAHVYGGPQGALAQLQQLEEWFTSQRSLVFFATSVIIVYDGAASVADGRPLPVRVQLVDFAHTYDSPGGARDDNFLGGLKELQKQLAKCIV